MADARNLLRQQRAARQQAQASHKQSLPPAPASKKRKALDISTAEKKRTRTEKEITGAGLPAGFFDTVAVEDDEKAAVQPPLTPVAVEPPVDPAADAELDAFIDEMNQESASRPPPAAYSAAVIEAAPMTAAELAAQAREEQSAQRAKRDEEMEGEKEDAAQALQDEFDEMEGLEERVRALRERREALRAKPSQSAETKESPWLAPPDDARDEEDSGEDDDWDNWLFRPA